MKSRCALLGVLCLSLSTCATTPRGPAQAPGAPPGPPGARSAAAVAALQAGRFDEADREADAALSTGEKSAQAHLVRALTRYKQAAHQLHADLLTVIMAAEGARQFNHTYFRFALDHFAQALEHVEDDLKAGAADKNVSLELCLACWEVDWNHNGHIDDNDRRLFQVEIDAEGKDLPEDDPRRRPTFRFDLGDVYWGRAMVAFQRALVQLVLAYRFTDLGDDPRAFFRRMEETKLFVLHLGERERVLRARALLLDALAHSDRARREYLRETDDDREWVPNPRQRSHPLPLPVDQALYQTWADVVGDLQRLVRGEEGLDVAEVAQLGKHQWDNPPRGFIHFGKLLSDPKDITVPLKSIDRADRDPQGALADVFGGAFVPSMKPSPLLRRLSRMKGEIDHGKESFERKLRYLLWLN